MSPGVFPKLVRARVTRHEHYGFWVDFGEERDGVIVIIAVTDDPDVRNPAFPRVGSEIEAALLGYTGPDHEARLSMRPSDILMARKSQH